jgi:hypothetical protein
MASRLTKAASAAWKWVGPGGKWKLLLGAITALAILTYVVSLKLNLDAERRGRAEDAARVATERADALQTASTGRSAANEARSSARRQIATETTAKRRELDAALEANRAWADQPVPRAVADSLR